MVTVACPHCGMEVQIQEKYIGQQGKCKCCNQVFTAQPVPEKKTHVAPVINQGSGSSINGVKKGCLYSFIIFGILIGALAIISEQQNQPAQRRNPSQSQPRNNVNPYRGSTKPQAGFSMPSFGKQNVTFAQYNQIQVGMSYEQVFSIIGKHGEEMAQNRIEGVPGIMTSISTVMYQWTNGNGSGMNAIFQNNKLMQKAQFGLK